jgi:hypothetical protein
MVEEPAVDRVQVAVESFWGKRDAQTAKLADAGAAGGAARANGHMGGFTELVSQLFTEAGVAPRDIKVGAPYLPGYFRVRKQWDLVVTYQQHLVAAIEFKSQVGSVGKNFNNRFEEALGTATDTITAQHKYSPFGEVPPWLGYVFVLEESDETEQEDRDTRSLFPVDPAYVGLSYNQRYQMMLSRFLGDQVYQAGWFVTTKRVGKGSVTYLEPLATATAAAFTAAINGRVEFVKAVAGKEKR